MKLFLKIFSIFTPKELRYCAFLIAVMMIGAVLEAVGIGAILPLISLMGQPDFLVQHPEIAGYTAKLGITTHTELIIGLSLLLIILYVLKNLYLTWQLRLQINFSISNQIQFSKELMANYLAKPYLFHLNHNTATLLRNVNSGGVAIFSNILIPTFQLLTEIITALTIWLMLVFADPFTAIVVAGVMGGLIYVLVLSFRRSIDRAGRVQNDYAVSYIQSVNQGLGAIKETKVMRKEQFSEPTSAYDYRDPRCMCAASSYYWKACHRRCSNGYRAPARSSGSCGISPDAEREPHRKSFQWNQIPIAVIRGTLS